MANSKATCITQNSWKNKYGFRYENASPFQATEIIQTTKFVSAMDGQWIASHTV